MTVNAITDTKKGRTGIAPTYLHTTPITQCMFDKNVYKMTVVCCNYAVASYLLSVTTLPPGNRRRAFHWEKYRRSAGDSCIANEPPENAQWNAPYV